MSSLLNLLRKKSAAIPAFSLTMGDITEILADGNGRIPGMVGFDDDRAFVIYRDTAYSVGSQQRVAIVSRSGTSPSLGTDVATTNVLNTATNYKCIALSTQRVLVSATYGGTLHLWLFDVSGASPSELDYIDTTIPITGFLDGAKLWEQLAVFAFEYDATTDYGAIVAVKTTNDTISVGTALNVSNVNQNGRLGVCKIDTATALVSCTDSSGDYKLATISVSGVTCTEEDSDTFGPTATTPGYSYLGEYDNTQAVMVYRDDTGTIYNAVSVQLDGYTIDSFGTPVEVVSDSDWENYDDRFAMIQKGTYGFTSHRSVGEGAYLSMIQMNASGAITVQDPQQIFEDAGDHNFISGMGAGQYMFAFYQFDANGMQGRVIENPYYSAATLPTSLSDLLLWIDPSDTATITESAGLVSQINDKSGNGYHLTQATGASQPTTGTRTINGYNVLDFDGSSDKFDINSALYSLPTGGDFTVLQVINLDAYDATSNAAGLWIGDGAGKSLHTSRISSAGVEAGLHVDTGGVLTASSKTGVAFSTGQTRIVGCQIASSQIKAITDTERGPLAAISSFTGTTGSVSVAASIYNYLNGMFGEFLIYNRALTTSEINQVGGYLANKYGITWTDI